jgi:hypothetical protein
MTFAKNEIRVFSLFARLLLCFTVFQVLYPEDISVGGVIISIPDPKGFVIVTKDMQPLYNTIRNLKAKENLELVSYILEEQAPSALKGEIQGIFRRCSVQALIAGSNLIAPRSEFYKIRSGIKDAINSSINNIVRSRFPDLKEKLENEMIDVYKQCIVLENVNILLIPSHFEDERQVSFSAICKAVVKNADEKEVTVLSICTFTIINVGGKNLFIYVFAEEEGLEWSREISRIWVNAIFENNPE